MIGYCRKPIRRKTRLE